tara:strand:+ start:425 stop:640 length:216 start_codon:yes stop_codon:yes gene_type:complete
LTKFQILTAFPLVFGVIKKMKNNTTAGFEPTCKHAKGIRTLIQSADSTSQNDYGETARRKCVYFSEFISGQ